MNKRRLIMGVFAVLVMSGSFLPKAVSADTLTGLVGRWAFNETSGTFAGDSSGNQLTGTLAGTPVWSTGYMGNALLFDGGSDRVTLNNRSALDFSQENAFTISMWVNPTNTANTGVLFSRGGTGSSASNEIYYMQRAGDGSLFARISDGVNRISVSAPVGTLPAGSWSHIALVWNGSTLSFYKNGVSVATSGTNGSFISPSGSNTDVSIAADAKNNRYFFLGYLDDVRAYGRALTQSDMQELYEYTGSGEAPPDTTAPVVSSVGSSAITQTTATITWTTDEPANSRVDYGVTASYGNQSSLDSTLVASHSVQLTGLTANTLYHYRVRSTDALNNSVVGDDFTFTTLANIPTYTLSVSRSGSGSGTVTANNIDCGSDCSDIVNSGTQVTLNAVANSGSTFAGWSGGCTGTGACTITVSANTTITATFTSSGGIGGGSTSSLSQFGITWNFASPVEYGTFANGDYWVVGPVTITGITPASTVLASRPLDGGGTATNSIINGSMVNPDAAPFAPQGFDSSIVSYSAALNRGRPNGADMSVSNPLVLSGGSSLVSSISHANAGTRPVLTSAAVLTVLSSAAPDGSFRPPYQGTDKTLRWNKSNLDYSILKSLTPVASTPSLATVEAYFLRPWIEIDTSHNGRYMHPSGNQPDYGREISQRAEAAMLSLHLNYSNIQKETLYIRMVQRGLDIYGAAKEGGDWQNNGGHNQGRKMPMILAGLALNDQNILNYGNAAQHFIFQEDQQTWYVTLADTLRLLVEPANDGGRIHDEYITADIGLPEWGEKHTGSPDRDGRNWGILYRDINYESVTGHALMAQITPGAKNIWNWPAFFDYYDRAKGISSAAGYPAFVNNMWVAYRSLGDTLWSQSGGASTYSLTVSKSGAGTGTVSGGSVSCGATCTQSSISAGAQITLTASVNSGSTFTGWSGGSCSGTGSCTVTVNSNTTVTATFAAVDTTPPVVSVVSPLNGASVSGASVMILASATDNVGVVGVQFKLDGANLGSELTTAPYSGAWNTTGVQNGPHSIVVVARDAAGNYATSSATAITVSNTVADVTAPTIPSGLVATAVSSSQVNLSWSASSDAVGVAGYRIYRNGNQIGTSAIVSYSDTNLSPATTYSYTIAAYDSSTNLSSQSSAAGVTTQQVTVGVDNPPSVSNGSPSGALSSGTRITAISVSTNESAICKYSATPNTTFTAMTNSFQNTGGQSHSSPISSLRDGASYAFYVRCRDTADNDATADYTISFSVRTEIVTSGSGGGGSVGTNTGSTGTLTPTVIQKPVIQDTKTTQTVSGISLSGSGALSRDLSKGVVHSEVKSLQAILNNSGFIISTTGPGSKGQETEYFGPATVAALIKFQAANGIPATGFFGPLTRALVQKLYGSNTSVPTNIGTVPSAAVQAVSGATASGLSVEDISLYQTILAKDSSVYPEGLITGTFGPLTLRAVQKFQLKYGIVASTSPAYGSLGPVTRAKLLEISGGTVSTTTVPVAPTSVIPTISTVTIKTAAAADTYPLEAIPPLGRYSGNLGLGSSGAEVKALQIFLSAYPDTTVYPDKKVNGVFDSATEAAVGRYQILRGIKKSGDAGIGFLGLSTREDINKILGR